MEHFLEILTKPDNIPIIILMGVVVFYTLWSFKQANENDRGDLKTLQPTDKVSVWPYLTRQEMIAAVIVLVIMTVWSIGIDAPLEAAANPSRTPNPSKAPWYFLGLQEMLVYFDPWAAGVVFPSLIIFGLMAIPYIDINPKGNGYYTWKERKFAISTFLSGFLLFWVTLIVLGTFMRGAGWYFFWPWEVWDTHKVVALTNVDLSEFFGIATKRIDGSINPMAMAFGFIVILAYYSLGGLYWMKKKSTDLMQKMGGVRYAVTAFLFLSMMSLPIKMFLRIAFNVKYVLVTPWFNI